MEKFNRRWFFTDYKSREYTQYDKFEDMMNYKSFSEGNFLEFSIKFGDKVHKYFRSYNKVQNVLSNIGRFLKYIQIIFHVICMFFL